ncbi:hypothetical protein CR513_25507, partial [Mucuna pruriens]
MVDLKAELTPIQNRTHPGIRRPTPPKQDSSTCEFKTVIEAKQWTSRPINKSLSPREAVLARPALSQAGLACVTSCPTHRHLSWSRRYRSRTGKPKVVRGDQLVSQRTLMGRSSASSLLTVNHHRPSVSETESSLTPSRPSETKSSTMLLHPSQLLAETMSDSSLPRLDSISLFQEQVGILHLASSSDPLHELDPEIEITLRRLKKGRNVAVSSSSNFSSNSDNSNSVTNDSDSLECNSANISAEPKHMENND